MIGFKTRVGRVLAQRGQAIESILNQGYPNIAVVDEIEFDMIEFGYKAFRVAVRLAVFRLRDQLPQYLSEGSRYFIESGNLGNSGWVKDHSFVFQLKNIYISNPGVYIIDPFVVIAKRGFTTPEFDLHLYACAHYIREGHKDFSREQIIEHYNSFEDKEKRDYWMRVVLCEHPENFPYELEPLLW